MRDAALERLCEELGVRVLIVLADGAEDPDLAPFVGTAHLGPSILLAGPGVGVHLAYLTPMEREEAAATGCRLLTPESLGVEALRRDGASDAELLSSLLGRALENLGCEPGPLGLAGRYPAGSVHAACLELELKGWAFRPAHRALRKLRRAKTPDELEAIRGCAAAATAAMRAVARLLAGASVERDGLLLADEPLTAARLRREISRVLAEHGAEQPRGNIVSAGAEAAVPHSQGASERRLRAGEAIVVDLFPRRGLFADCARTFCVGGPSAKLARAHAAVYEALREASRAAVAGTSGWELQRRVCERFEGAGHPTSLSRPGTTTGYVHGLGHGVGFELHELPGFHRRAGDDGVLAPGDVFTLEPGLYDPEAGFGVRLEDLYHLGEAGAERLTPLPYDLDPRAWG